MRTLSEYKFRELVTSSPEESAFEAAVKMEDHEVGCVILTENKQVLGIATRHDFMHNLIVVGKNPKTTKVKQIMHPYPISLDSNSTMTDALRKMIEKKVERLVVRSGEKILGVISLEDVVTNLSNSGSTLSPEWSERKRILIMDMVRRLTPSLLSRYDGQEKEELQREMNDEATALLRLLEEAEVTLRH
ncbi:MAG: CBS domain-containing protein [Nitrososphaerales archaeon]